MTQEVEIEYKNMLTKQEYERLLSLYGGIQPITWTQTNYYADTHDLKLKKNKSALRIRELPDKTECTLKTPYKNHLMETTIPLDKADAQRMIQSDALILSEKMIQLLSEMEIHVKDLSFLASLSTERFELQKENCLIVLDKSIYGTKQDFELEIEATNEEEGIQFFNEFLTKHDLPVRKTDNKVKRAFKEKGII